MDWDRTRRFYPIIDSSVCESRGLDTRAVAEACMRGGARLLQLRVKHWSSAAFLAAAEHIVRAARGFGASVIVNDRADIARMAAAEGVHVGQEDLPPDAVRRVFPNAQVGLSTHNEGQVDLALQSPANYVAVGPVYETATKNTGYPERGLRLIEYAAGRGRPIVAIGGITLERASAALDAGAAAVAVISDVLARGDIESRVREYMSL